ncbi:MAG: hypothetical protein KAT05_04405 [Spirochaetes bacterium]|nr:hypothetical protein [Spirochaetota bacterium]
MKKKKISLLIIITSIIIINLITIYLINEFSPLRNKIFLPRKTNFYPKIGNDIKINLKNKKHIINGLLSLNSNLTTKCVKK